MTDEGLTDGVPVDDVVRGSGVPAYITLNSGSAQSADSTHPGGTAETAC